MTTKQSAVPSFLFAMFESLQALWGQIPFSRLPSLRGRPLSALVFGPKAPGVNRRLPREQLLSNSLQRVRGGHGIEVHNSRAGAGSASEQLLPNPYSAALLPAADGLIVTKVASDRAATYPVVGGDCNGDRSPDVFIHHQSPTGTYLVCPQKSPTFYKCACAETKTEELSPQCIQNITLASNL